MTPPVFCLLAVSLVSYVAGQILFKHAMEPAPGIELTRAKFTLFLGTGIVAMTISFFLTLGLLQHFDLSYIFPFQGLTVIMISSAAALLLKERLTLQLATGAILIGLGVMLVSTS